MIVYKATNNINGKIYVGITVGKLEQRVREHLRVHERPSPFQCALKKYGVQSFTFDIIDTAVERFVLCEKERYWIKKLECRAPNGYNLTEGGDGITIFTPEMLERNRQAHIGKKASEETKAKMRASSRHLPPSLEQRERARQRMIGSTLPEETRRKIGEVQRGIKRSPRSEETKAKLSAAHKGKKIPLEVAAKIAASLRGKPSWNKGRTLSDEHRRALSLAHTGHKHSQETRRKMSDVRKGHPNYNYHTMSHDSLGRFIPLTRTLQ